MKLNAACRASFLLRRCRAGLRTDERPFLKRVSAKFAPLRASAKNRRHTRLGSCSDHLYSLKLARGGWWQGHMSSQRVAETNPSERRLSLMFLTLQKTSMR
jgi:hypothetical protein